MELKQVFQTTDGQSFETRAEALRHMRRPQIIAALKAVAGGDSALAKALYEHQEEIEAAFETGKIQRVTKAQRNMLKRALEKVAAADLGGQDIGFLVDNMGAIVDSFRWPTVARMDEEEKAEIQKRTLSALFAEQDNAAEVADWIIANHAALNEAYKAGQPTRTVSPAAAEGLRLYQEMKAAEKALAEAQEAGDAEAIAAAEQALTAAKNAVEARRAARAAAAA